MKKVGLALSSGGARGFAHIGVIKVLEKNNIPIDYIAGTSMGALVAAYYALYGNIDGLEKFGLSFKKQDLIKYIDLNNPKISLIKGEKAKELLERFFGNKTFKDTKIPLKIGATALEDGKQVVLESGKIWKAVLTSGTIPGLFPPIKYKGKHLVDGGLADATPVNLIKRFKPDVIIAVDLFGIIKYKYKSGSVKEILYRTQDIMMSKLAHYSAKEYGENIIVLKPQAGKRTDILAFHKAREKIRAGEIAAKKSIKQIKSLVK